MNDGRNFGKTVPEFGRSGIYYGAGDNRQFRATDILQERLGSSYSAGLQYFKNNADKIDNEIWKSNLLTEQLRNNSSERRTSTEQLRTTINELNVQNTDGWTDFKVTADTLGNDQSTNYTVDESSLWGSQREMPPWRKMLLDPMMAGAFLSRQWPRVSLRASLKAKSPVEPSEAEEEKDHNLKNELDGSTSHRTRWTICVIITGILIVIASVIPVIVVTSLAEDDDSSKVYVIVNMSLTITSDYNSNLNDTASTEYQNFGERFCYEIGQVYRSNSSIGQYYGCKVSSLRSGSIIVYFLVYFTDTSVETLKNKVKLTLTTHLTTSSSRLGMFVIDSTSTHVIEVSANTLVKPPIIQGLTAPSEEITEIMTSQDFQTTADISATTKKPDTTTVTLTTPNIQTIGTTTTQTTVDVRTTNDDQTSSKVNASVEIPTTAGATTILAISTKVTIGTTKLQSTTEKTIAIENATTSLISTSAVTPEDENTTTITTQAIKMNTTTELLTTEYPSTRSTTEMNTTKVMTTSVKETATTFSESTTNTEMTMTDELSIATETTTGTMNTTTETTTGEMNNTEKPSIEMNTTTEMTTILMNTTTETTTIEMNTNTETTTVEMNTNRETTTIEMNTTKDIPTTEEMATSETTTTEKLSTTNEANSTDISTPSDAMLTTKITTQEITNTTEMKTPKTSTVDILATTEATTQEVTTVDIPSTSETTKPNKTNVDVSTSGTTTPKETTVDISATTETTTPKETTVDISATTETTTPKETTVDISATTETTTPKETTAYISATTETTTPKETTADISATTETTTPKETTVDISATTETTTPKVTTADIPATTDTTTPKVTTVDISTTIEMTTLMITTTERKNSGIITTTEISTIKDLLTTSEVLTTSRDENTTSSTEFSCNSLTTEIFTGPEYITCSIETSYNFTEIGVSRGNDVVSVLQKNGSLFQMQNLDPNITISWDNVSKLTITFLNINCYMNGTYYIILSDSHRNVIASRSAELLVTKQPGNPVLELDVDQVIDLLFDDGNFYRQGNEHICKGDVGNPPGELSIQIMYPGSSNFQSFSDSEMKIISRVNSTNECVNTETLTFAINFTKEMDGGKLKCFVPGSFTNGTVSDILQLIPRNVCACASTGLYKKHPKRCDVEIFCLEDKGLMYPTGEACPSGVCVNNTIGRCDRSVNCTEEVCSAIGPTYICTTPSPPTTTPLPSLYVTCNDLVVLENSGPQNVSCIFNASFAVANITFRVSLDSEMHKIGAVEIGGNIKDFNNSDSVSFSFVSKLLTIQIQNVSCTNTGYYGVSVDFADGNVEQEEGKLSIIKKPIGSVTLTMHPDQIADLGFYRGDAYHSCEADVGNPAGSIKIEMMLEGGNYFTALDISTAITDTKSDCTTIRKEEFGISFTSEMDGAVMRCRVDFHDETFYSNNATMSLIPHDVCQNSSNYFLPHPTHCHMYIHCYQGYPYGKRCDSDLCFGVNSVNCDHCYNVLCSVETTTFEYTTTLNILSTDQSVLTEAMNCTAESTLIGNGPASIGCIFTLSADLLNITITRKSGSNNKIIAIVESGGNVDLNESENLRISYTETSYSLLSMDILIMACEDEGEYLFVAYQEGNVTHIGTGQLIAKRKPGQPVLKVTFDSVVNELERRYSTCTANVGNPAGSIHVLVKKGSNDVYSEHTWSDILLNKRNMECDTEIEFKFRETFTSEWNNTHITCKVDNEDTVDENENMTKYTSEEDQIILIQDDYCSEIYNRTTKYHPKGCSYFVECVQDTIHTKECPDTLCINGISGTCDFCNNVNASCNFIV